MDSELKNKLVALMDLVWGCDIPSPTVPEYVEHHRDIQQILKAIDKILEEEL